MQLFESFFISLDESWGSEGAASFWCNAAESDYGTKEKFALA